MDNYEAGKPGKNLGYVVPSFDQGSVVLKNSGGKLYRLLWNEVAATSKDRRRGVPAGDYTMVGYRLNKRDNEGKRWDLSATHAKLRKITVEAGVQLELDISETITIKHRLSPGIVDLAVGGVAPAGLTIYREGKRIPIQFELLDETGKVHTKGRFNYG
ncbi:MAG: hypothetical protein ACI8X5_000216 [Planctomycetota bacterium]